MLIPSPELTTYHTLEDRITTGELDAMIARWLFGRQLLEERGSAKRLPNGRVRQLWHTCQSSAPTVDAFQTELSRRMRLAEHCRTEAESDPALAAMLRGIAQDEERHAALGWQIVSWCVQREPAIVKLLAVVLGWRVAAPRRAAAHV